jgi:dihydropyrimidine dehydrogenase (NAD+) subunit PreA
MADLKCNIAGIPSINPFWLASAPPTDKKFNVERAFQAGWGGVVWKTVGEDPPVVNLTSRYGAIHDPNKSVVGINNIELISDRSLQTNLDEIRQLREEWPDRVIIGSLMATMTKDAWVDLSLKLVEAGCQGLELNFGCPHGMCERGMGSAIGQVPSLVEQATRWVVDAVDVPVLVKLTPNVTDILVPAEAALKGGRCGGVPDQHGQFHHECGFGYHGPNPYGGRSGNPRRLLRYGGQAYCPAYGGSDFPGFHH